MSLQAKRQGVCYLVEERDCSERKACQVVGISRSSARYQRRLRPDEATLRSKIRETAEQHPTYGCPRITVLIRREGSIINHKLIHRLWKEEGLQLPRRRPRKRYVGPKGEVKQKAEYPNHVWSYDFVEDRTEKGNKLRFLTVMDEFTREALALPVQRSFSAKDVIATLEWIALQRGLPAHIRSDNGPEFVAQAVTAWIEQHHCNTIFITPGSPWENSYIESLVDRTQLLSRTASVLTATSYGKKQSKNLCFLVALIGQILCEITVAFQIMPKVTRIFLSRETYDNPRI